MLFVLVAVGFLITTLILAALQLHYSYWTRRNIPQLTPTFIIGNVDGDAAGHIELRHASQRLYAQYKHAAPLAGMYIFLTRVAVILNLELVRDMLERDFDNFEDRGIYSNPHDDPLSAHLFRLKGAQWRALRHKLTPMFSTAKMQFIYPIVVEVGKELAKACEVTMRERRNVVEMEELSARYTTDVIANCVFGIECNSLQDPDARFPRQGRGIFKQSCYSQLVEIITLMNANLARQLHFKVFPQNVSEFYMNLVRSTVNHRRHHGIRRNDFMDLLIELKAENDSTKNDGIDLSQGLTLQQLTAQAAVFFVAGFETSSTTMALCLYELALNPDIQEQLRVEILRVLRAHNYDLSYEAMNEMIYLEQVLAETLRKYPVQPFLLREAKSNYQLPNSKYIIEKGRLIIIPVQAIHHDPELYPEPERFDPTRFTQEAIKQRHAMAYLPFGEGPRSCIGQHFGRMQIKIGLIDLLRNYRFSKCEKTAIPLTFVEHSFLVVPKSGIYLRVDWA